MVVDPPGAGDDLGVPGGAVAHSHSPSLRQATRGDRNPWSTEENGGISKYEYNK